MSLQLWQSFVSFGRVRCQPSAGWAPLVPRHSPIDGIAFQVGAALVAARVGGGPRSEDRPISGPSPTRAGTSPAPTSSTRNSRVTEHSRPSHVAVPIQTPEIRDRTLNAHFFVSSSYFCERTTYRADIPKRSENPTLMNSSVRSGGAGVAGVVPTLASLSPSCSTFSLSWARMLDFRSSEQSPQPH